MFIDTHCHLFNEYYDNLEEVLFKVQQSGICHVINAGCDRNSCEQVLKLAKKYDWMYCAIGIHPEAIDNYREDDLLFVERHLNDKGVVAIGEIGLDYHYGRENRDKQIDLFLKQLSLAEKYELPVVIHTRDALQDTIECLKKFSVKGVIHSFSGSYETACIFINMGFVLGVNGVVTFKNCKLKEVYERVRLENVVLETDSPYLTPVPFRGQINDSSHILDIAKFVAELKGVSLDNLSKITNQNVSRVFDIDV